MYAWADKLACRTSAELYRRLVSHWDDPSTFVLGSSETTTVLTDMSLLSH